MAAGHAVVAVEGEEELEGGVGGGALGQPVVGLDVHPDPGAEGLDRLDAADVRARHDAAHGPVGQQGGDARRLGGATFGDRAGGVVAVPFGALSGVGVAHQEEGHAEHGSERRRRAIPRPRGSSVTIVAEGTIATGSRNRSRHRTAAEISLKVGPRGTDAPGGVPAATAGSGAL